MLLQRFDVMYFSYSFYHSNEPKYALHHIVSHHIAHIEIYICMRKDLGYSGPYKIEWLEIMQNGERLTVRV